MLSNVSAAKNMVIKKVIMNVNIKMMVKTPVYIVVATMNPEIVDSKKIAPSGTAQIVQTAKTRSTKGTQKVIQQLVLSARL